MAAIPPAQIHLSIILQEPREDPRAHQPMEIEAPVPQLIVNNVPWLLGQMSFLDLEEGEILPDNGENDQRWMEIQQAREPWHYDSLV